MSLICTLLSALQAVGYEQSVMHIFTLTTSDLIVLIGSGVCKVQDRSTPTPLGCTALHHRRRHVGDCQLWSVCSASHREDFNPVLICSYDQTSTWCILFELISLTGLCAALDEMSQMNDGTLISVWSGVTAGSWWAVSHSFSLKCENIIILFSFCLS